MSGSGILKSALWASTAILMVLGSAATAQEANEERPTFLGIITLFADRVGRALTDVQGNISVVGQEEITERNIQSLEDLVRYLPGVTAVRQVSGADPFGGQTGIRIRGVEGNRVQMIVDGGRIPERIIDGSRDYLDMNFTKQVDVVRGPASVLWGADALGGVLSLETIGPDDLIPEGETSGGQLTAGYGELTTSTNIAAAFAQRFGTDIAVMLGRSRTVDHELDLSNARDDGGIYGCTRPVAYGSVTCGEFNPLDRTSDRTLFKFQWSPDDTRKLTFTLDHLDRLAETNYTLALGPSGTSFNIANPRTRDIHRTRYALDYEAVLGGPVDEVRATLAFTPSGYDQTALLIQRNAANEIINQIDYVDYAEDFFEVDIQGISRFDIGGSAHVLTFGFDGDYTTTSYDRRRRVLNLTTGTDVTSVPSGFNFTDGTTVRADLYIQDQILMFDERLELTPGLRYATYAMDPTLNDSVVPHPDNPTNGRDEARLLKSIGATWRFDETYSVWAHYGEGFKMPTFQQLYTSSTSGGFDLVPAPDLVPEDVESIEIGFRGEYASGFWAVNAFKADYSNFIQSFYFVPATNDITYRNLSAVRTWGVEFEGAYQVGDQLEMTGSVAWMDGEAIATPGADPTQHLVPPLTAVIGLAYDVPERDLTLRATGTFVGAAKPTSNANYQPAGYGLLDLGASWNVSPTAQLNLAVNNVFDKRYFELGAANVTATPSTSVANTVPLELFTGPGRNISLTLDVRF